MKLNFAKSFCLTMIAVAMLMPPVCLQAQSKPPRHNTWRWKQHRVEIIDFAKKYLVSDIEPGLPRQSFSRWFRAFAGREARVSWTIVDCGWAADDAGKRDKTMCTQVDAALGSDVWITVYIQVGTFKDGISKGKPIIRYARVSREDEPWMSTNKLTDLPGVFNTLMSK